MAVCMGSAAMYFLKDKCLAERLLEYSGLQACIFQKSSVWQRDFWNLAACMESAAKHFPKYKRRSERLLEFGGKRIMTTIDPLLYHRYSTTT